MLVTAAVLGSMTLSGAALGQPLEAPWAPQLNSELDRRLRGYSGELGMYVLDVERNQDFGRSHQTPMYLASGVKLAFMTAVFAAIEEGRLSLDTPLPFTEDDLRDGAPRANKHRLGRPVPVRTLLEWMMRYSDNAASDLFVDELGLPYIQDTLVRQGLLSFGPLTRLIEVRRGVYRNLDPRADDLSARQIRKIRWTPIWNPQLRRLERELGRPRYTLTRPALFEAYERFYATKVNRAPMAGVAALLAKVVAGTLVSQPASARMLQLMSGARTSRNRLLGRLPRNVKVAHKTGSQYLRFCDLGVVFLPRADARHEWGAPLIVTMCTARGALVPSERLMASAARKAYDLALGTGPS